MKQNLYVEWRASLSSISRDQWQSCFQRPGFVRSYDFHRLVEQSSPPGVAFQYLLAWQGDALLAIISCFRYELSLAVTATATIRKLVDRIERIRPGLFTVPTFCVGQLTAVCDHLYGLDALAVSRRETVLRAADQHIRTRARELGCWLTMVKEIPTREMDFYRESLGDRYIFVDSLPNALLDFDVDRPYAAQLRSKYRNLYKKRTRAFAKCGLTWRVVAGSVTRDRAREMEQLYARVLARSENQFERLTAEFFYQLCARYSRAFALLCLDGDRLVGFSINVEDDDRVCGLYLGYDDPDRRGEIYFNLMYKVIEVARSRGKGSVQLGQTSYQVKSALGARPAYTYLGLEAHNRLLHLLLGRFGADLFPVHPFPERTVFARKEPKPRARIA